MPKDLLKLVGPEDEGVEHDDYTEESTPDSPSTDAG